MKTSDFYFELPENLIAQHPPAERGRSRLLAMDRKKRGLRHSTVRELPSLLEAGTLLAFNNSRVRRARLFGVSEATGAKAEFLLINKVRETGAGGTSAGVENSAGSENSAAGRLWRVMAQRAGRRRPGSRYVFAQGESGDGLGAEIIAEASIGGQTVSEEGEFRFLKFDRPIDDGWLDAHGHIPLPPYIKRPDTEDDGERYQTVYSREYGSAAAPTAGLHFTKEMLAELERAGMESVFITLHVGLGTFLPVRAENVEDHRMHEETYTIDDESAGRVEKAKAEGRKVLAVGTTSVRALESAWTIDGAGPGRLRRGEGATSIYIYPGYAFKAVDAIFTNFHTPGSTLLMLAAAFAGRDFILEGYREAIKKGYRFFSYGDACLIQ